MGGITKETVNLASADNTNDLNKPIPTATQNALNWKASTDSPTFTGTIKGITKGSVNVGNVDNTSDLNKPISSATQLAPSDLIGYLQTMHYNRDEINGILADFF